MLGKIILWICAVSFIGYGVACLVTPSLPAELAGLVIASGDGFAELGAMYGGLQTGFGLFCLLAALRPPLFRPGLLLLAVVIGCLASGRLISTLAGAEPVGVYTWGAMVFEFGTAILAGLALRSAGPQPAGA